VFAALVATQPLAFFLLASTAITIIAVGSGAGASTLWFFSVLRRHDLRLAFASD
jgi:predicted O-methyltransferase YrrM